MIYNDSNNSFIKEILEIICLKNQEYLNFILSKKIEFNIIII